jgi:hypothetical protein
LPEIAAAAEKPVQAGVTPPTSNSDDADVATSSARDHAGDRDPSTAPEAANDDEPVPISMDHDAEDRTLDR